MVFTHCVISGAGGFFLWKQVDRGAITTLLPLHSYNFHLYSSTEDKSPGGSFLLLPRASIGIHWSSSVDGYSVITIHIHCAVDTPHSKSSCSLPSPVSTNYLCPAFLHPFCTFELLFGSLNPSRPVWKSCLLCSILVLLGFKLVF